ncbi:MAG: tRNA pseudouridine(13) synthase TruD [Planctomycetes bacterium]|nr:tRNA pseudouridine(13) synthase TruD [Planctomycetota bacterium]
MKIKSRPEDFVVDEVSSFVPDPLGRYFVYELAKRSLSTFEALGLVAKRAGMHRRDLSPSGLKDKHGLTRQLFSSPRALPGDIGDDRVSLKLVGKCDTVLTPGFIVGNRFEITLRNLRQCELDVLPRNIDEMKQFGIPNYYDNQRFGGIAHGQGFIGRALALGNFEEALRLHLAAPHRKQSLKDKTNRRLGAKHWGDWKTLHGKMRSSPERALVEYLIGHPDDFAGCFERITPFLRNMFIAAYQSYLFNETLRRMVLKFAPTAVVVRNKAGEIAFYRTLPDNAFAGLELPLPGPGTRLDEFPQSASFLHEVLKQEGLTLSCLSLSGLERTGFKSSTRSALMLPEGFECGDVTPDDLNEGTSKIVVKFQLGRGSFATIVTRRLVLE